MKHPEFITGWAGFLQVENAVMTFILFLLGFSICCINGRELLLDGSLVLILFSGVRCPVQYGFFPPNQYSVKYSETDI